MLKKIHVFAGWAGVLVPRITKKFLLQELPNHARQYEAEKAMSCNSSQQTLEIYSGKMRMVFVLIVLLTFNVPE